MRSDQVLASGLRRCTYTSRSAHRAMSTTMSPIRRPLCDGEKAPPPKMRSQDSSARLWKPSKGINIAPSAHTTTWNPAYGIVFSENKPSSAVGFQKTRESSRRTSSTPPAREISLSREASSPQCGAHRTSKPTAAFPITISSPPPPNSVGFATADGEEVVKEVAHHSTVMQTATPNTISSQTASTGGSCRFQRAGATSVKDQRTKCLGIPLSTKKGHETCGDHETRSADYSKACYSGASTKARTRIRHIKFVRNTDSKRPPIIFRPSLFKRRKLYRFVCSEQQRLLRSLSNRRRGAHRENFLAAAAVLLEQSRKRYKSDEVRLDPIKKLASLYKEFKGVFRASNEAWSALQTSQAEAYTWMSSEGGKAQVAFIGTELRLLRDGFHDFAHEFREFRFPRVSMDVYNSMNREQQYLSLRHIRATMIDYPFAMCLRVYWSLFRPLYSYLRTLELNGQSVPGHIEKSLYDQYIVAWGRVFLSESERYNLYRLVFNPQVSEHTHVAAVSAAKVRQGAASVLLDLKTLRASVVSPKKYVKPGPAFIYRVNSYESWGKRVLPISVQLKILTRQYEEIIIRCASNHARCAKPQPHADTDVVRGIPKSAYPLRLSSPALDIAKLHSLKPIDTGAAVENSDQSPSGRPDQATNPSSAPTIEDLPRSAELHTIGERTKRRLSLLKFIPSNPLHYSRSTHDSQSQADVMDGTLEDMGPDPECKDHVTNKHLIEHLPYQIPEAKLKEAMLSSRTTTAAYWRYSLYEHPTGGKVKVHYCKSKETTERTAQLFLGKEVVGFDIEWKPQAQTTDGLKKNVSLIQLASEERIALFHIARYPKGETVDDFLAPTLKSIMEDPNISKVGVSVKSDCTRLRKFMGIESRGLFELSHLYKLVKFSPGNVKKIDKRLVSLAQQVEEHLQLPLWKGDVRSSDWSTDLNYQQMQYAASDSYAGLQLYLSMESKRKALDPTPPRPYHAELNLPIRLASGQAVETSDEAEDTAEKPVSDEIEDTSEKLANDAPLPAPSIEEMAREFMDIAIEDSDASKARAASTKAPEVVTANVWVAEYRASRPSDSITKATPAFLRAYSLWHHQEVEVADAAKLLRDPPLQSSTVCCYILEAVRIEKLPFGVERLREVLRQVEGTSGGRYLGLKKLVE